MAETEKVWKLEAGILDDQSLRETERKQRMERRIERLVELQTERGRQIQSDSFD